METELSTLTRTVFKLTGADTRHFLQTLVTNDVARLDEGMVYTALLTPQGKYLADFFLVPDGDAVLVDVATGLAPGLQQRLSMYKLRSDVTIEATDIAVTRGLGTPPEGAFTDPRDASLGWRGYAGQPGEDVNWDALRVAACVPESGIELTPDTFILEAGFERLNGVDFRKGCYVGQEVTARMKHKTALRKGLARVKVEGTAPVGSDIEHNGKLAGTLYSQAGNQGIAYLRFDRAGPGMCAGDAAVHYEG
ncbi:folate-binding protein YgfZ [Cognatishimia sp. F0-27]|uniref:CAF17-like 4Fe-4S cluster assembly/insertion protein YgfZ n=1 Tax=Cognatishimia sp. F0-27 TaxID=2816855 RepID=UPI001D0C9E97|nr:folate-binding protein [Cognatishimia sp. F0-27]MCC1494665.1 folate-binding protein YgfZ [Cognatishimia sp. F0-27]